ncbi:MAG: flagellar basal body-associated FliL family protein [Spirochaetaceae bacterium]|jgi:flagellar FliL protein|nr:flagellar basal body-associated FliL family protein [Spirochaetaceae bacterium]
MADDDDDLTLDDSDSGGSSSGKKGGGLGALLPNLLKWIAIVIGAIALIVTIVVITFNILNKNASQQVAIPVSPEYVGKSDPLSWNTSLGTMRMRSNDPIPASITVEIALGYKPDDKTAPSEIAARTIELRDFLRRYFMSKTVEELRPQNEDRLRIEIRNAINDDILSTSKILDVRFLNFDVIEQ